MVKENIEGLPTTKFSKQVHELPSPLLLISIRWPHLIISASSSLLVDRHPYQSDAASVKVLELDLELASGTLGGVVTTVE
ncbi:hypothetical protein Goshw_019574, partial [Gossypium schwendimanii]|nr:hypothetical protein [Gossypium schwendimanii]